MHHLALGVSPVGLGGAPFAPALAEPAHPARRRARLRHEPRGAACTSRRRSPASSAPTAWPSSPPRAWPQTTRPAHRHRHRHQHRDRPGPRGPRGGHELCLGPGLRGLPDRLRHEGRRGRHRARHHQRRRRAHRAATIGGREPLGICGSGVVDLLAGLVAAGVVDPSGRLQDRTRACGQRPRTRASSTCSPRARRARSSSPSTTCARCSSPRRPSPPAAKLLLAHAGLEAAQLEQVLVAGAFGNELDVDNVAGHRPAARPCPRERVAFVGNAAGVGAQMALIDVAERRAMASWPATHRVPRPGHRPRFHEVFTAELGFA